MGFDSPDRNDESIGDIGVAESRFDEPEDFRFACGDAESGQMGRHES